MVLKINYLRLVHITIKGLYVQKAGGRNNEFIPRAFR